MSRIVIDARKIADFGIGTYIRNLLCGMERLDPEHEFLIFLPPREPPPTCSARFQIARVQARNYGIAEHLTLPFLARRYRAELYHAPHYVLPWFAPRPSIVTVHDLIHLRFPEYLPSKAAYDYARIVMGRSLKRAARVLTVSEASKRDLLDWFGLPDERVVVVPNSIEEIVFAERSAEDLERARERWRLHGRFILYTGNVKPHKNLVRLVQAFARLRERPENADVRLVLMGNDLARYHGLRRLAAELRVVEHVRFLGWVPREELYAVYRLASLFAYPSLYEGFGLPPLEAMASGVPVVASNTSSLPEVCGDAAVLVDPLSVEAIAAGLDAALSDEALRKDLIRKGYARAEGYRGNDPAARVLAVYRQAMEA